MKCSHRLIVHGIICRDNKVLVIKRSKIKRGKKNTYPEYWDIPGGSVEQYELPKDALVREVKEESNLDVTVGKVIHEDSQLDEQKHVVFTRLVYICDLNNTQISIILDKEEHSDYRWITYIDEMKDELVVPYLIEIMK